MSHSRAYETLRTFVRFDPTMIDEEQFEDEVYHLAAVDRYREMMLDLFERCPEYEEDDFKEFVGSQ